MAGVPPRDGRRGHRRAQPGGDPVDAHERRDRADQDGLQDAYALALTLPPTLSAAPASSFCLSVPLPLHPRARARARITWTSRAHPSPVERCSRRTCSACRVQPRSRARHKQRDKRQLQASARCARLCTRLCNLYSVVFIGTRHPSILESVVYCHPANSLLIP